MRLLATSGLVLCAALASTLAFAASPRPADSTAVPAPRKVVPDIRNSPGYVPLHDPDSMDVVLDRRRNAPLISTPFVGGASSLDELGRAVCHSLHTGVPDSMLALCVRSDEFRVILWPEFPQSRPITGFRWEDAWMFLFGHLNGGSVSSVREYEGSRWEFIKLRYEQVRKYRNFRLYRKVTITARSEDARVEQFTFVRSIAERKGRFKIYSMRD